MDWQLNGITSRHDSRVHIDDYTFNLDARWETPRSRWPHRVTDVTPRPHVDTQSTGSGLPVNKANSASIFYNELKRRNVFRVAAGYVVSAWLIAQVAELLCDGFDAPEWILQAVLISLAIGFVPALVIAWFFEFTTDGLKWDKDIEPIESITHQKGRRLDFVIMAVLVFTIGFLLVSEPRLLCSVVEDKQFIENDSARRS